MCVCAFLAEAQLNLTAAQDTEAPQTGTLEQTISGHYKYESGNRVSGIILTNEGVVVVDVLSSGTMAMHERQLIVGSLAGFFNLP